MMSWSQFFQAPPAPLMEKQRSVRLVLAWVFAFVVVVRSLALVQFLMDLDYSEVNSVRLIQFVFVQATFICFLSYFLIVMWRRPHRFVLWTLFCLCAFSLYRQQDLVSVISALTVGGLGVYLYRGLYRVPVESDPQQQLPMEL